MMNLKKQYAIDTNKINRLKDKQSRIKNIKRKREFLKPIEELSAKWKKIKEFASGAPPIAENYYKSNGEETLIETKDLKLAAKKYIYYILNPNTLSYTKATFTPVPPKETDYIFARKLAFEIDLDFYKQARELFYKEV